MINQLGKINFPALTLYLWRSTNFELFQDYVEAALKELANSGRNAGIIYGGIVTPTTGLSVAISKALVLFSDGTLVTVDDSVLTLGTANGSNPRYDRIELGYTLADGATVENIEHDDVILDKLYTGAYAVHAGTPAGSPVAPTLTSGKLSIAIVHVAALQTTLTSPDVSQVEDTATNWSGYTFPAGSGQIRFSPTLGKLVFSNDGATWNPIAAPTSAQDFDQAIAPSGAGTVVTLEAGIAALPGGGGALLLQENYTLNTVATLPDNSIIFGKGPDTVLTIGASGKLKLGKNCVIHNIGISTANTSGNAVEFQGSASRIHDVFFILPSNSTGTAVYFANSACDVSNCRFAGVVAPSTGTALEFALGSSDSTYSVNVYTA